MLPFYQNAAPPASPKKIDKGIAKVYRERMSYCDGQGFRTSPLDRAYHDTEWGVPVHDDRRLFEALVLELMQCGLNWQLILRKREHFRQGFAGYDIDAVAAFGEADVTRLLAAPGMIRSERKLRAVIANARAVQAVQRECGSFAGFVWPFCGGRSIAYEGHAEGHVPASNALSAALARELKRRGFRHLGPVTVYSFLQACGIINDHEAGCPCYRRLVEQYPCVRLPEDAMPGLMACHSLSIW